MFSAALDAIQKITLYSSRQKQRRPPIVPRLLFPISRFASMQRAITRLALEVEGNGITDPHSQMELD